MESASEESVEYLETRYGWLVGEWWDETVERSWGDGPDREPRSVGEEHG